MKQAKKRRLVNESINCYEKDKTQTVLDPMTAHAIAYSERKDKLAQEAMKGKGEYFDGAPKQPHPKKVEVPKSTLEESLFEDYHGTLTEGRWEYNLKCGKALRDAINDEDYPLIKELMIKAWKELEEQFPDAVLESDYEDIEFLDTEEDEYTSLEDIEDNFNYELGNLYDFCDAMKVWIPLDESCNSKSQKKITESFTRDISLREFLYGCSSRQIYVYSINDDNDWFDLYCGRPSRIPSELLSRNVIEARAEMNYDNGGAVAELQINIEYESGDEEFQAE